MKKAAAIITALAILLSFAACTDGSEKETTTADEAATSEAVSEVMAAVTQADDSPLLLTLFRYPDSEEYKSIQKCEKIETGLAGEAWKLRAEKDGVKVRIEYIRWVPEVCNFQVINTVFETEVEKGKYYVLTCPVAETIPEYRLVADDGKIQAVQTAQQDGAGEPKAIEMIGESYKPTEINEDSPFYALCLSHAITAAEYHDNEAFRTDSYAFWQTFAFAVTKNYENAGGDAFNGEKLSLTEWLANAYLNALYPTFGGKYPDYPDGGEVVYTPGRYEEYEVRPCDYGDYHSYEFYGVEDNGDGTYSLKFRVYTYPDGNEVLEDDKAVIVEPLESFDNNNPFGYVILRVEDCSLPMG